MIKYIKFREDSKQIKQNFKNKPQNITTIQNNSKAIITGFLLLIDPNSLPILASFLFFPLNIGHNCRRHGQNYLQHEPIVFLSNQNYSLVHFKRVEAIDRNPCAVISSFEYPNRLNAELSVFSDRGLSFVLKLEKIYFLECLT